MGLSEVTIVSNIQNELRDSSTANYSTANIHLSINEALRDIAEVIPEIVLATVTTQAGTRAISIGSIAGTLLYGEHERSFEAVEFPVDKEPPRWRTFSVKGSMMHLDIDFDPDANEDVRIYQRQAHRLDGGTSTLNPTLEKILVPLAAGKVIYNEAVGSINVANVGDRNAVVDFQRFGQDKIDKAMTDLRKLHKHRFSIEFPRDR